MVNKKAAEVALASFVVVFFMVMFILEQFNTIRNFQSLIFWVALGTAILDSFGFYWYFRLYYRKEQGHKRRR